MRSSKLQALALLLLINCQVFAFDYRNLESGSGDCKCTCDCNSQPDAWGNTGLPVILKNINGVITKAQSDKWLADITNAAKAFPDFCNSGNEQKDKQEFTAFLTIIGAETSFDPSNGFPCTKENGCPNCDACSYNSQGKQCSTTPNLQYYGRGPLQLSWDYNYNNFSQYYFKDNRALTNPDIVTQDQQTCWASAIWFWMTPQNYGGWCMPQAAWPSRDACAQSCPNGPSGCSNSACTSNHWLNTGKASPHDAIQTGKGIGQVINIINGGYDCCPSTTYKTQYGHTVHRIEWYAEILQLWGEPLPYSNLSTVPIEECPAAQGTIDCSRLAGTCYWNCCSAKS
ncbi:hypothetical protein ABPG72_001762 [Tetrahymena utriculariae]